MGASDLIAIFKEYGIKGGVGIFIIIAVYILHKTSLITKFYTHVSEHFVDSFMKKRGKVVISDVTLSDITNHDIFTYIDFWMHSRIPTFQFSTDYRTVVFKRYLHIYLKTYKDNFSNFVNARTFQTMDESELWKSLLSLINQTVYDYEKEMVSIGIPQIVITKMKVKNNDTISLTIDLIEGICNSQFYNTDNLLKVYSILNILLSILENTIHNSESVCNSINGALKGLTFNDGGKTYKEP